MAKPFNVGVIGMGFMGRAHSNAYRKVNNFFPLETKPVLKTICAVEPPEKLKAFAETWGYESYETDWRKLIDARRHPADRHLHSQRHAQGDRAGRRRGRQEHHLRETAGHDRGGSGRDGGGRGEGGRCRTWCASITDACRPSRWPSS